MKGLAANGYGEPSPGNYDFGSRLHHRGGDDLLLPDGDPRRHLGRAPAGFAPIAIGLCLTLIHLISIPVTNTSVNPARSTGPAFVLGGVALQQLWMFWVAPILGGVIGGLVHRWLGTEETVDALDRAAAAVSARSASPESLAPMPAREPR